MIAAPALITPANPSTTSPTIDHEARQAERLDRARRPVERPEAPALGVDDVRAVFRPASPWEEWLAAMVAATATRAGECPQVERALRDRAMFRAAHSWDEDRKLAAENLAAGLARNPARVVAKLRATPAGVDWLIARWHFLARVEAGRWMDDDRTLAAQLLGGDEAADPTSSGFIDARIAELEAHRERAVEVDEVDRELARAGLLDAAVPELARLRSHERALHRRLTWCLDQFKAGRAAVAAPGAATKPIAPSTHPARCPGPAVTTPLPPSDSSGRIVAQGTKPMADLVARPTTSFAIRPTGLARPPLLMPGELHDLLVAEGLDGTVDPVEHRARRVDPARAARRARDERRRRSRGG